MSDDRRKRTDSDAIRQVASVLRWTAYALAVVGLFLVFIKNEFLFGGALIAVAASDGIAVLFLRRKADMAARQERVSPEGRE